MARVYAKPPVLVDVLEEHVDEAAFLYRARRLCLVDPELSWLDLAAREERLDAHLDALAIGGMQVALLLRDRLVADDLDEAGPSFAAAAAFPSLGRIEPMLWLRDALAGDPPNRAALVEGLRYGSDPRLEPWIAHFLEHEAAAVRGAGAELAGWRLRADLAPRLEERARDPETGSALPAMTALFRLGREVDLDRALDWLREPDARVVGEAGRLLLATGETRALPILRSRLGEGEPEARRELVALLGAVGGGEDVSLIREQVEAAGGEPELEEAGLLALGASGDPSVSELLIARLADPARQGSFTAAFQALRGLSGVDHLPEFDLEEPEPGQAEAYAGLWESWWSAARSQMRPELRWRLGRPVGPEVLVEDLLRAGNPRRDLGHLELQARYGCRLPFAPDGRYAAQAVELGHLRGWAAETAPRFQPGVPYFAGRPA